tara:strand:+ start:1268 stop:2008 length:741 start_codon:yes stop_codon:yes gene_type:complete
MIKFFSRFRQRLLPKNKFSKYFIYAIGEIVLVVIGILIALQINNWNENTKKNKLKASYISALIVDYTKDSIQLDNSIALNKLVLEDIDSIIKSFYSKDIKLDDFIGYFKSFDRTIRTQNNFNTNSFNVLITSGNIDLIDEDLVEALMELNRLQTTQIEVTIDNNDTYIALMVDSAGEFPIFSSIQNFSKETNQLLWKKVDVEKIPVVFTNIIGFKRYVVDRYLELAESVKIKTDEVLSLLNSRSKK